MFAANEHDPAVWEPQNVNSHAISFAHFHLAEVHCDIGLISIKPHLQLISNAGHRRKPNSFRLLL